MPDPDPSEHARGPKPAETPDAAAVFDELCRVLGEVGVEIRKEPFDTPLAGAGGLCVVRGHRLVLLDARASRSEQARALLEAVEQLGWEALGLSRARLSPELRRQLGKRGRVGTLDLRRAPGVAKTNTPR